MVLPYLDSLPRFRLAVQTRAHMPSQARAIPTGTATFRSCSGGSNAAMGANMGPTRQADGRPSAAGFRHGMSRCLTAGRREYTGVLLASIDLARTPKSVLPAELLKIPKKPSASVGASVASNGKIETSTKVKVTVITPKRLSRRKPTRPSHPAFSACLA